jgi:hypothetical protein
VVPAVPAVTLEEAVDKVLGVGVFVDNGGDGRDFGAFRHTLKIPDFNGGQELHVKTDCEVNYNFRQKCLDVNTILNST